MAKLVPVDFDPFSGATSKGATGPKLVPVDFDPFAGKQTEPLPGQVQLQDVPGFISTSNIGPTFYTPIETLVKQEEEKRAAAQPTPQSELDALPRVDAPLPLSRPPEFGPSEVTLPSAPPEESALSRTLSALGDIPESFVRGYQSAKAGANILGLETGQLTAKEVAKNIADSEAVSQENAMPESVKKGMEKINKAQGWRETLAAIAENPDVLPSVLGESAASSLVSTGTGILGALTGAVTGSVVPGFGTVAGGTLGFATGTGVGSAAMEYASTLKDFLNSKGYDVANPEQLEKAFSDPVLMAEARKDAAIRGVAVGTFDALTAGVAGKLFTPVKKTLGDGAFGTVAGSTAEIGSQALGGAGGEATAQLGTKGEITDKPAVVLEAAGELIPGLGEIAIGKTIDSLSPKPDLPAAPPTAAPPTAAPPSGPAAPPAAGGTNLLPVDFDPFQPAAPSADVENQAGVLKSAGYAVEDIAEMTEGQRLALVAEAVDQGVKPTNLTAEEKAVLAPAQPPSPAASVEAQGPGVAPAPEAPSAQAQALVDAGASPLEAIQQAGAEGPVANKPVSEEERLMKEFQDNWQAEQDAQKPIEAPPISPEVQQAIDTLTTVNNAKKLLEEHQSSETATGFSMNDLVAAENIVNSISPERIADLENIINPSNKAPPAEVPSVGAANITSSKTKNGWVIQTRGSDGKVLAEHGPFKDPKTAQNKVSELISSNTRATVETNKMVTPEGIATGFKRQDRGTYSTLIGYIKSKGGIRDDGGELKARGMNIPGLINPRGMTIQDALRGAIDRGFYPDYVERGAKDDNYLPPKEMVEQFKDDIAARKKLPDPEKEAEEERSREQDEENDRLSYYEDRINETLNDLGHTGTDRLKREAAIIMYNGEEDPLTALELAHLGEIADDLPGEHDSIRDITSDEYWSTVEDHLIDREEEISNEVEQRPTPETGTAPRETGKQEQAPATEEAEGRGKPVEKAVVKSPENDPTPAPVETAKPVGENRSIGGMPKGKKGKKTVEIVLKDRQYDIMVNGQKVGEEADSSVAETVAETLVNSKLNFQYTDDGRVAELTVNENVPNPVNATELPEGIDSKDVLVLIACSSTKADVQGKVPLRDLYTGAFWQILNKYRGNIPSQNIRVLSGKYGIVSEDFLSAPYDEQLTKEKVDQLINDGINPYDFAYKGYKAVILAGGGEYRRAFHFIANEMKKSKIVNSDMLSPKAVIVETTGGIGEQRGQFAKYLNQANGVTKETVEETEKPTDAEASAAPVEVKLGNEPPDQVGVVKFDQVRGYGSVPDNQNVDYKGFVVMMKPEAYLTLAKAGIKKGSKERAEKIIIAGKPIGSPFLDVDFSGLTPRVVGHDGRHRMMAIEELQPNVAVPVHIFGANGLRAKNITSSQIEDFKTKALNEDKKLVALFPNFGSYFHMGKLVEEEAKTKLIGEEDIPKIQKMLDAKLRPGYKVSPSGRESGKGVLIYMPGIKEPSYQQIMEDIPSWIDGIIRLVPEEAKAPTVEKGAEGKPQLVIPGAERIGDKEYAERLAGKPLKATGAQAEPGGMFAADVGQPDLIDLSRKTETIKKAAEEQPFLPENVIKGKPLTEEDKAQRDEVNILTDIPPEAPPPPPKDMSLPEAEQILKGKKLTVEKRGDRFLVGGNTFNYKSIMRDNNGRWDAKEKSWSFTYDPTKNIAASIKEVDSVTSSTRDGGQGSGPLAKRGEDERIRELRKREDGRPDERISNASAKVSDGTKSLIANGLKYGIPQEVVNDQIEDIGMALNAFDKGKPMFLLANEAGTGKTFVLGGLIRDLRSKGVKKFVYVTQSQDLIGQIKDNLKSYDIGEVQFVTYAQMDADVRDGVLIFDEAHNVKNVADQTGRAVEGQRMMQAAKMTIFASATPFQNPVEAAYLAGTGVFNASDGFIDWAKAYGSFTQKITFFNPKTKQQQTVEKLYWVSTPERKKDGAAARNWFLKQGVMTQRAMKIDPKMVDVTFQRNPVDKKWVDLYNKINEAYDAALAGFENEDGGSSDNKVSGEIKRHRETMIKRILEAAKANAAIDRAKNLLADGKNVVIFVETKADRAIGRFRRSTFFKDDTLYSYDQMERMMSDWAIEEAGAKMIKATPPPRPFAAFIYAIAQGMNKVGLDQMLPSTADDIRDALGGKDKVAIYTGAASQAQAKKDKEEFLSGRKKVIIATMAKGGTGLSLHDTIGNRPTVQVNLNLPWAAWQVDQVSARVARYGLQSKANVEWLFASNIPWESDKLAPRIGARMADMGAIVKGIEIRAAEKLLGDFDFEGTLDVKNKKGEGDIEYSSSGFTPRAEIIIPNVISRVEETVRRLVGDKIAVEFVDKITMVDPEAARMSGGEEGVSAAGSYDNANGIIKLALDMDNPASPLYTAYHEAYHPISSLLTEQEKAILRNSVDELRSIATKFYRMTNEQFDALSPDEQEAYAFGAYGYMMDESMGVPAGPARGIMGRLRSYWKSIVGAIKSALGKRTYEDIFSDIHLGRLRERFDTARINMPSPRYAAKNNQPNLPGVPAPATQQPTVQNILPGLPVANRTGLGYEIKRSGFGSKFHYLFTEKFVDLFDWIKAVEAARGAKIQDSENAAFANALFQDRAIALQNKANEEELQPLIKAMDKQGISTGDMGMFLYAMHAPERNEVMRQRNPAMFGPDGAGSGMTDDEAADIMQQFKDAGKYDDLMQIAKDHIYPMIKKDVKLRYTSGLLTQEQYDQYNESRLNGGYDYYVPLTGYAEDENQLEKTPPRAGKGFAVYGQEYKTAFGRNSLALNPLFSLINRRMEGITRTEKTRVISRLYNFVRNNPNPDYAEIVKPGTEFTKKLGADGTVQVVPTNSVRMDPFVITHKIGGKEVYIRFNNSNPNMARLVEELKNMTQAPDTLMKATMAFGRYMSKINTQWVVDFMMVNFPRDVQDSLLTIYGEKKGLASGMIASIAKSGKIIGMHNSGAKLSTQDKILLDEWVESGGKVDYTGLWNLENTVDRLKDQLQEQLTDMNAAQKSLSIAKNMGNGVLEAIETINDTFDSTVRLAVYMSARKAGYTKEQAALLGRRSTVDFRTGGKLKPFINAAYPFAGTAIAGSKALTRILRSKRAWQAIGGVVMASMFSSLLGTYLSDDDEEDPTKKKFWTEIKDYNRHNSIILPFKINGRYVKFAAGFYISTFWSLGDQMAGVMTGNIKPTDAAINVATSIANAFNPLGSGSLIHNIIPIQMRPFIETYMNKDWQNKDMHPEREGRSKSSQYYDKTSETAVTIADWVNRKFGGNPYESSVMDTYPANIDYWFNFITGGAGAQVTNSGKAVYDYFNGADIPAEKLPFVRRVVTSTQNIDDSAYSKVRNEVGARSARLSSSYADSQNMAISKENRAEAREVSKELKRELGSSFNGKKVENPPSSLPGIIRETDKSVKELEERIDKINIRNDLSAIQKKALVDPIQNKITAKKNAARKKIIYKEQIKAPPAPSPLNQLKTMFQ
jgi:hypothetical protein